MNRPIFRPLCIIWTGPLQALIAHHFPISHGNNVRVECEWPSSFACAEKQVTVYTLTVLDKQATAPPHHYYAISARASRRATKKKSVGEQSAVIIMTSLVLQATTYNKTWMPANKLQPWPIATLAHTTMRSLHTLACMYHMKYAIKVGKVAEIKSVNETHSYPLPTIGIHFTPHRYYYMKIAPRSCRPLKEKTFPFHYCPPLFIS